MNYEYLPIQHGLSVNLTRQLADFPYYFSEENRCNESTSCAVGEEWHIMRCDGRPIRECREGISTAKG